MLKHFIEIECKQIKPTRKHSPALWENMLGTVYARNAAGETRYFDYDWEAAKKFAGIDEAEDLRLWRNFTRPQNIDSPRMAQLVLYIKRKERK